jgi:hypothetical protein
MREAGWRSAPLMGRVVGLAVAALAAAPAAGAAHPIDLLPALSNQAATSAPADPLRPAGCPATTDPASFTSTDALYRLDKAMANFGPRPTGSPAHERFIDWLQGSMGRLPGMRLDSISYGFKRWTERTAALSVADGSAGGQTIPIASTVPYSKPSAPVTAPLVYVAAGTDISTVDVRGKIVVRDFLPASIPNAVFTALQWWEWDPDLTLTKTIGDNYVREYLSGQRETDLSAAAGAGAAGLVFVHQLPGAQAGRCRRSAGDACAGRRRSAGHDAHADRHAARRQRGASDRREPHRRHERRVGQRPDIDAGPRPQLRIVAAALPSTHAPVRVHDRPPLSSARRAWHA